MFMERIAPQSEVMRVIVLEDSPCEVPHQQRRVPMSCWNRLSAAGKGSGQRQLPSERLSFC